MISKIRSNIPHDVNQEIYNSFLLLAAKHNIQKERQHIREHYESLGTMLARVATAGRLAYRFGFDVTSRSVAFGLGGGILRSGFREGYD